jgi:hypothetical protein
MNWSNVRDEKDNNGQPTKLALAVQALIKEGCGCGFYTNEDLNNETCLGCVCEDALHEQFYTIQTLQTSLKFTQQEAIKYSIQRDEALATAAEQSEEIERLRALCYQAATPICCAALIIEDECVDSEDIEAEREFAQTLEDASCDEKAN